MPKVSVVIAVYNGAAGLQPTVDSLRAQTFTDFEVIVVDDGSTDGTAERLADLDWPALRVHRLERNRGQTAALNVGVKLAQGEYIARHDVEDTSTPGRFAQQVAFLDDHPEHVLVGSCVNWVDEREAVLRHFDYPTGHKAIVERLPHKNAFGHGAVMLRRRALEASGGYREEFRLAQDLDLWLRLSERGCVANLPGTLYSLRFSQHMASIARNSEQNAYAALARQLAAERQQFDEERTDLAAAARRIAAQYGRTSAAERAHSYANWARKFHRMGGPARRYVWPLWLRGLRQQPFSLHLWKTAARILLRR